MIGLLTGVVAGLWAATLQAATPRREPPPSTLDELIQWIERNFLCQSGPPRAWYIRDAAGRIVDRDLQEEWAVDVFSPEPPRLIRQTGLEPGDTVYRYKTIMFGVKALPEAERPLVRHIWAQLNLLRNTDAWAAEPDLLRAAAMRRAAAVRPILVWRQRPGIEVSDDFVFLRMRLNVEGVADEVMEAISKPEHRAPQVIT